MLVFTCISAGGAAYAIMFGNVFDPPTKPDKPPIPEQPSCSTSYHDCDAALHLLDFTDSVTDLQKHNALTWASHSLLRSYPQAKIFMQSVSDDLVSPLDGSLIPLMNPGGVDDVSRFTGNKHHAAAAYALFKSEFKTRLERLIAKEDADYSPIAKSISDFWTMAEVQQGQRATMYITSDMLEYTDAFTAYIGKHGNSFDKRNSALAKHLDTELGDLTGLTIRLRVIKRSRASQDETLTKTWVDALRRAGAIVNEPPKVI